MRKLVIDGKTITDEGDCFVIAEVGHNHQGKLETAKEIVAKVSEEGFVLEMTGKTNKEGGLYAAINEDQISAVLKKGGLKVSSEDIKIENPIKSVGDHEVLLDFGSEVKAKLQLRVQP